MKCTDMTIIIDRISMNDNIQCIMCLDCCCIADSGCQYCLLRVQSRPMRLINQAIYRCRDCTAVNRGSAEVAECAEVRDGPLMM